MNNNDIIPGFNDEKDDCLKIRLDNNIEISNSLVLYLNGYIDTYNSPFFQERVSFVIQNGYINLIFECSGLHYISSTGIGSFTAFLKQIKLQGGDMVLVNIQAKVYEVFQLLGFSQFFSIKDTMEDAVLYFREEHTTQNDLFPRIFACPVCSKKLKASKPGRFRCSECKTILIIDDTGQIFLGQ
ncbi:MAG: anti-sigma factor antagonist [Spirochaetaceae bacterium]|jgi:anti-anti-sigma factor|nr:anti-sigma factor antagonist [Spirochaetaceae bacterium]